MTEEAGAAPETTQSTETTSEGATKIPVAIPVTCAMLHAEGPCDVLHLTSDGRECISAGGDGKIAGALQKGDSTEIPARAWTHRVAAPKGALTAAAITADRTWLATGQETDNGFSVWVSRTDGKTAKPAEVPKLVSRFTLPVRHLAWHPKSAVLGIASDDGKLTIWDRDGTGDSKRPRRREFNIGASAGGVRCLAFDPLGELLAAALTNGDLVVYGMQDLAEKFRGCLWPKAVIGREQFRIAWRPDGEVLALPGEATVRLATRGEYARDHVLLADGHRHPTTTAAWSPNSKLLATASPDVVCIWRPPLLLAISSFTVEPCSLLWGGDDYLAVGTTDGSWTRLDAPTALGVESPKGAISPNAAASTSLPDLKGGSGQDDQSELFPTKNLAKEFAAAASAPELGSVTQIAFQPGATSQDGRRNFLAWNEHGALKFFPNAGGSQDGAPSLKRRRGAQPLSSCVGRIVVEYSRERGRSAPREFQAPHGLSMGALGPGVCALATNIPGRSSCITVHLATSWERPQFEHKLPQGESIEALAVGRNFVAALMSPQRYLRVHTWSGLPLGILALSGNPVCLVACEGLLLCITETPGRSAEHTPVLEFALYGIVGQERLASGRLPITPRSVLRWVGFSAEALPLTVDSAGVVRALTLSGAVPMLGSAIGDWLPVVELEDGGVRLWPVRAENGALLCAELPKPGDEPRVNATLKLRDVPYHLPLGADAELPERVLRQRFLSAHLNFAIGEGLLPAPTQKAARLNASHRRGAQGVGSEVSMALKLFRTMAKSGDLELARDVASVYFQKDASIPDKMALEEAIAISKELQQDGLVEKISQLLKNTESQLGELEEKLRGTNENVHENEAPPV